MTLRFCVGVYHYYFVFTLLACVCVYVYVCLVIRWVMAREPKFLLLSKNKTLFHRFSFGIIAVSTTYILNALCVYGIKATYIYMAEDKTYTLLILSLSVCIRPGFSLSPVGSRMKVAENIRVYKT